MVDAEIDAAFLALSTLAASHGCDEGGGDLAALPTRGRSGYRLEPIPPEPVAGAAVWRRCGTGRSR